MLVQWIEDFKSNYENYKEAKETIEEVEKVIELYKTTVEKIKIPLDIQNYRNARKEQGSILEYGFDYHVKQFNTLVSFSFLFFYLLKYTNFAFQVGLGIS